MKYQEAGIGRTFVLRLEHEDRLPDTLELFAQKKGIQSGLVFFLGGAAGDSKVVVGPEDGLADRIVPMITSLAGTSEALGVGTIFQNTAGTAKLHLHSAFGRGEETVTGCTREGVDIWHIGEVVILELVGINAERQIDRETGFELLELKE
ncbi:DNA-binding protein [Metallumcola ferriviriculae]|uniref:DNA-binding protein n=1 Tax=Metallumcola ferriviriculae TaxID=3039180 RepID=A0AAU0UL34_9FIRM|nr:DNA-binding protein [Desulfitibacteraceae bacterium MK1]